MGVRPSMGTVGEAYDNAMAERFFASLVAELIERNSFESKAQARMAVFTWIEGWHNPRRRYSGLGYLSPLNLKGHMRRPRKAAQTTTHHFHPLRPSSKTERTVHARLDGSNGTSPETNGCLTPLEAVVPRLSEACLP